MLQQLRLAFPQVSAVWTPGRRYACGGDGAGGVARLAGTLDRAPVGLRLAGRRLVLGSDVPLVLGMVADDVIAGQAGDEDFLITFANAQTLIGMLPPSTYLEVGTADGVTRLDSGDAWLQVGAGDALALAWSDAVFALGYGRDVATAMERAQSGLGELPWQQAEQRLAGDCQVAAAPLDDD